MRVGNVMIFELGCVLATCVFASSCEPRCLHHQKISPSVCARRPRFACVAIEYGRLAERERERAWRKYAVRGCERRVRATGVGRAETAAARSSSEEQQTAPGACVSAATARAGGASSAYRGEEFSGTTSVRDGAADDMRASGCRYSHREGLSAALGL